MSVRAALLNVLRALRAALAATTATSMTLVWEGGRWVSRVVRALTVPPDVDTAALLQVEEHALTHEQRVAREREAAVSTRADVEELGCLVLTYIVETGELRERAEDALGPSTCRYLDGLTLDEQAALLRHEPLAIAECVAGQRRLPGVPTRAAVAARALAGGSHPARAVAPEPEAEAEFAPEALALRCA